MKKHNKEHHLAWKKIVLPAFLDEELAGRGFVIEDWWDRLTGVSWMFSDGNPACIKYAIRTGMADYFVPTDDEVVYGHTDDGLGHLVHVTELPVGSINGKMVGS